MLRHRVGPTALALLLAAAGCSTSANDAAPPDESPPPEAARPITSSASPFAVTQSSGGPFVDAGPPAACVRNLTFWHAAPVWPTEALDIGGRVYTDAEMRALLELDRTSDASVELAQDFIATHLNDCDGCFPPPEVHETMDAARAWFAAHADADGKLAFGTAPASPAGMDASRLAADLRAWLATAP